MILCLTVLLPCKSTMLLRVINLSRDLDCCWLTTWCQANRNSHLRSSVSLRLIDKVCHSQTHCIAPTSKDFHVAWLEWSCRLFALCVSLSFSPISTSVSRSRQCIMGKDRPIIDASSFDRRRAFKFFVVNVRDFCVTRDYISPAFNS